MLSKLSFNREQNNMKKNELAIAPTEQKTSILAKIGGKYSVEPKQLLSTLKDTAFKGATDSQMVALCVVADQYGLNPFTKEIYAFPDRKSGGIVPVIGVDGWYRMLNDNPAFDGVEFEEIDGEDGAIQKVVCRIFRKDRSKPTEICEHLSECKRNTEPWNNQPRRMLRHRAFIQCARIAFGIAGTDPEEAERIGEYEKQTRQVKDREIEPTQNPFKISDSPPDGVQGEPETGDQGGSSSPSSGVSCETEAGESANSDKEGER